MITGVGFEVYTVMWIQIAVLWAAALCGNVLGVTNCLHLQD
jgi:hypothetical protein